MINSRDRGFCAGSKHIPDMTKCGRVCVKASTSCDSESRVSERVEGSWLGIRKSGLNVMYCDIIFFSVSLFKPLGVKYGL